MIIKYKILLKLNTVSKNVKPHFDYCINTHTHTQKLKTNKRNAK